MILKDHGLMEIMVALKNSRVSEVRELLTALLWNLSSCEELKLKMIKGCLHDLVEMVMVPYSGWNTQESREPTARPQALHWNAELKNTTGLYHLFDPLDFYCITNLTVKSESRPC